MAVILRSGVTTSSGVEFEPIARATSPAVPHGEDRRAASDAGHRSPNGDNVVNEEERRKTGTRVLDAETGEDDVRAETTGEQWLDYVGTIDRPLRQRRRELADRLTRLAKRVMDSRGKTRMAADVEVLKHELSRCHDVLGGSRSESNFLSIVTLVEACLASMDWKNASKEQLAEILKVLSTGCSDAHVTFEDFDHVSRVFRTSGLRTMPSFDVALEEDRSSGY